MCAKWSISSTVFNAIYLHSASQLQVFTVFLHILLLIVVFVAHQNSFISPRCISVLVCCALCYCWVVFHVCLAVGLCVSRGRFNVFGACQLPLRHTCSQSLCWLWSVVSARCLGSALCMLISPALALVTSH